MSSIAENVDPEEAFVASIASCHMLFFLYHAARGGFVVDHYEDAAVGIRDRKEVGVKLLLDTCVWGGAKVELAAEGHDVVCGSLEGRALAAAVRV